MTHIPAENASEFEAAALDHGLFPAHTPVFLKLADRVNAQGGLYHVAFGSSWLRDYYLGRLATLLELKGRDILTLTPETDVVTFINPRLESIALSEAILRTSYDTTSAVVVVADAAGVAPESWTLLFALMRDLPVLNLACVACWLPEQQAQQDALAAQCREYRELFCFELEETAPPH